MFSLLGDEEWLERSPFDDEYVSEDESEPFPLDDDYNKYDNE